MVRSITFHRLTVDFQGVILKAITNRDIPLLMYDIRTIEALVTELGGPTDLGRQLGIVSEAVSNWVNRQSIPGGWHLRLLALSARRGLTVDPRVFNLTESDIEGLRLSKKYRKTAEART